MGRHGVSRGLWLTKNFGWVGHNANGLSNDWSTFYISSLITYICVRKQSSYSVAQPMLIEFRISYTENNTPEFAAINAKLYFSFNFLCPQHGCKNLQTSQINNNGL